MEADLVGEAEEKVWSWEHPLAVQLWRWKPQTFLGKRVIDCKGKIFGLFS